MSRVPLAGRMVMALEMSMGLVQRPELKMVLAPRMIQSMEILQLPIMALQERIQQELQENPVLELKESDEETAVEDAAAASATEAEDTKATEGELVINEAGDELDFNRLDALSRDWEDHFNEEHRPSRNGLDEEGDKKHDAMQNMPSRPQSLHDYLNDQISFLDVTPLQGRLMRYLITHIDDRGYLAVPLEDLARNYDRIVATVQLEVALKVI